MDSLCETAHVSYVLVSHSFNNLPPTLAGNLEALRDDPMEMQVTAYLWNGC